MALRVLWSDRMWRLLLVTAFAACGADDRSTEVVGPFTGETHRFVVDVLDLPKGNLEARAFGGDLDGNGVVDNQLGMVVSTLDQQGVVTKHAADMIAGGAVQIVIAITADNLVDDPTVGVTISSIDAPSVEVGGTLVAGRFVSNRSATASVPGQATLQLPVFDDADPSTLHLEHVQLELAIDADGVTGLVQGALEPEDVKTAAHAGAVQMLAARPEAHRLFIRLLDKSPRDWQLTREEFATNSLITSLLAPEVELGGRTLLGLGLRVHARPCAAGACLAATPFDHCFDRLHDPSEAGIDCGGTCARACGGGETCAVARDCQSGSCDANNRCAAPACGDGLRNGFETDVDCGSACGGCALGDRCEDNGDCASGQCGPPCPEGEVCFPEAETCESPS